MEQPTLPRDVEAALTAVWAAWPPERALSALVVTAPVGGAPRDRVAEACAAEPLASSPALRAGLWLYVDELEKSHQISQSMDDATGAFWHGIMHRREGDFGNSKHWFRRAGSHPAMERMQGPDGGPYDASGLIDAVDAAHRKGEAPDALIEAQRIEWLRLFEFCAAQ